MDSDIAERRKFQRRNSHIPMQYRKVRGFTAAFKVTTTQDIGAGGVRLGAAEFIPVLTRVGLEISLPSLSEPIKVIAGVVWIYKKPDSKEYELGLEFIDIAKEDRVYIASFVEQVA